MSLSIVILEDNAERRHAMHECLRDRFEQYPVQFFVTAGEMIAYLQRELPNVLTIGLDHDLDSIVVADQRTLDPGTGSDVADFLNTQPPTCPVVIATTNVPAGFGMEQSLAEAGWTTERLTPYGDLEWVSELWFPTMCKAIVDWAQRGGANRPLDNPKSL